MAGAYCRFCGQRCFVYRIVPGSTVTHLATCRAGKELDMEILGVDADTAVNPLAAPVIICETDSDSCTCGAPVSTPAGMHHNDCPTNPASHFTAEEREARRQRLAALLASIGSEDDGQEG